MSKRIETVHNSRIGQRENNLPRGKRSDRTITYGYFYEKDHRPSAQKIRVARTAQNDNSLSVATPERKIFSVYCEEWLRLNRCRVKESTLAKYIGMLEKHIAPKLGKLPLSELSSLVIEQFSYDLLEKERLSPKTVKDILTMLNGVIRYINKQYPQLCSRIEIIYPKVPKNEMRVLSYDEQTRFIHYLLEDMDECKFGVLLALFTGMRIGEVCALRWEDISMENRTIRVNSTMQRLKNFDENAENKTKVIISSPKSDKSLRMIPLTENAAALCRLHYRQNPSAFVLSGEEDRYVEPRSLQYKLKQYTEACGLEGVHFHTLRHTFATRCIEVDFDLKSLSEILGHSSPRITLERYVHSSFELKRNNMNKLAAMGF